MNWRMPDSPPRGSYVCFSNKKNKNKTIIVGLKKWIVVHVHSQFVSLKGATIHLCFFHSNCNSISTATKTFVDFSETDFKQAYSRKRTFYQILPVKFKKQNKTKKQMAQISRKPFHFFIGGERRKFSLEMQGPSL